MTDRSGPAYVMEHKSFCIMQRGNFWLCSHCVEIAGRVLARSQNVAKCHYSWWNTVQPATDGVMFLVPFLENPHTERYVIGMAGTCVFLHYYVGPCGGMGGNMSWCVFPRIAMD